MSVRVSTSSRRAGVLGLALLVGVVGVGGAVSGCGDTSSRFGSAAALDQVDAGPVTVVVRAVPVPAAGQLAAVLSSGDPADPTWGWAPIGGFGVRVTRGRFSTTQDVRTPDPRWRTSVGLFPYVTGRPLDLPPGKYTLYLWVGRDLGPWEVGWGWPGLTTFRQRTGRLTMKDKLFAFCETTFGAKAFGTTVTVTAIPRVKPNAPSGVCSTG